MSSMADLVHQALFYDSPEQLMATLAPFIMKALRRRHAILAVTTSDNIRAIESGLGGDAEEVEFVESSDWYHTPGQTLAAYHRYVQDQRGGHDRVWLIGELAWQDRDTAETDEWIRYDSAYNLAFAGLPASIICLFDQTRLPPAIIADARRTHPLVTTPYGSSPTSEYADPARFWNERTTALAPAPPNAPSLRFGTDPRPVRAFVARHVAWWGLSPERIDDLVIAVNEVTTNAIKHGAGHGVVRVWREGSRLLCEVSDPGHVEDQLIGFVPGDPEADHGHGLWLTRQLTDTMDVRNSRDGTTVRLHIHLD